jgi:hypothetical protein
MSAPDLKLPTLEKIFDKLVSKRVSKANQDDLVALSVATGCVCTVFKKNSDGDHVRKCTTVPQQNGKHAVGSKLDPKSDAFGALNKGKSFRGHSVVLNKLYEASYFPIDKKYSGFVAVPL